MLLLLVSIVHLSQASRSSVNSNNLFIGLNQTRTFTGNLNWKQLQHYYQSLQARYFKRLLYVSLPLSVLDLFILIKFGHAWLILVELGVYLALLFFILRKVEKYIQSHE
ncbi:hypothetical protein BU038_05235 [Staphylococcus simulans]|nr:hypothetical protein BU038_05235 [Staphylococcus simulans]